MTADIAPVAHGYNAPYRASDQEASFNDLATAQAYAAQYGGEVEARGVAFVVGPEADHETARNDLVEAQRAVPQAAPNVASDIDAAVARAIERERESLRAEFEAEQAAWRAEHPPAESTAATPDGATA